MSQEELAYKAGLNRTYIWDLEKGRNIFIKTAYKISKALNIQLKKLFDL